MSKKNTFVAALALALSALTVPVAHAAVTLTVTQSDGTSWVEDLTGLSFMGGMGGKPTVNLQIYNTPGSADLIYAVSVVNTSALAQTYTFSYDDAIASTVGGAHTTYADIAGGLTNRGGGTGGGSIVPGNANGVQRFELSSDGGQTFVNAGVDVGPGLSFSGTSTYGVFSASNAGGADTPVWNYMRLVSSFTLSGNSAASLSGFASISPVPEPGVGGMMLLGIGLIGTIVRRRRIWS